MKRPQWSQDRPTRALDTRWPPMLAPGSPATATAGEVDPRRTSTMLGLVSRFALLVPLVVVGCSVPTPVGELQQVVAGSGATSTTDGAGEDSLPSVSSSSGAPSATTGSSGASDPGSSSGNAIVAEMSSFVIRRGDLPIEDPTDTAGPTNSSVGTGSEEGDPDDLLVTIGVTTASCQDPNASDPCQTWTATLVFTPEQQITGTYTDTEIDGFYSEQGAPDEDGVCPGTGGSLSGFTIILESIDETGLELVFEGDGLGPDNVDLNGMSFSVPRC